MKMAIESTVSDERERVMKCTLVRRYGGPYKILGEGYVLESDRGPTKRINRLIKQGIIAATETYKNHQGVPEKVHIVRSPDGNIRIGMADRESHSTPIGEQREENS